MNGPHDLGGHMGFGAVAPQANEPLFHAHWEERALGVTLCSGALGLWTLDESRHARESLHPADYYSSSYYEIWIKALEALLLRHGCVSPAELVAGQAKGAGPGDRPILKPENVAAVLAKGAPCNRPDQGPPRYDVGQQVRIRNVHPAGHTRIPGYAKGHVGVIEEIAGTFVFPDDNAHGEGENPQWLYRVVLEGRALWGEKADPLLTVSIDAWEGYLEPA